MTEKEDFWKQCQQQVKKLIPADQYKKWIKPLRANYRDNVVLISATNGWEGRKVQDSFGDVIEAAVREVADDGEVQVQFDYQRTPAVPLRSGRKKKSATRQQQAPSLEERFTFERFVTGSTKGVEKAMAWDAANSFNDELMTLVIFGDSGFGKTHLLHAIGHRIYEQHPDKAIKLTHSTSFVNEVTSILAKPQGRNINAAMRALQSEYTQHDVILMDDLHRLAGKDKTQAEFLELLNIWQERRTKLAFVSLAPIAELEKLNPALRSRLLGGVSIQAMEPDEDAKVQILLQHAAREDCNLPQDVAEYLAQQLDGDIRVLKGTLLTIVKAQRFSGRKTRGIGKDAVDRALGSLNRQKRPVTAERVLDLVSDRFNVSPADIKSNARVHSKLIPRQIGMLLTREFTSLPYTEIATAFGRKDHTTVKNALEAIERKMRSDVRLRRDYDWLKSELRK